MPVIVSVVKRSDFKSIHSFKELDELFLLFKDELGYISDENDLILTLRNRFSFLDMNEESKILKIFLTVLHLKIVKTLYLGLIH